MYSPKLDEVVRYDCLPDKTINFDIDAFEKPPTANTRTLSSSVSTRFRNTIEDTVVTEVWDASRGGDITAAVQLAHKARWFIHNAQDAGQFVLWYPKDKTDKVYTIFLLDPIVGSPEESDVNPMHDVSLRDDRWLISEVKIMFRILKPIRRPEAVIFLEGA